MISHYTLLKWSTLTSLFALLQLLKNRLFSITWKHLCEPDFCMWRPTLFFRIAFFPQEKAVPLRQASTQWHHCTYSVKYGWCDAHSTCVGGVICQEIPPGNYLLVVFASVWSSFLDCEGENCTASFVDLESRCNSLNRGRAFFFFFCIFATNVQSTKKK